MSLRLADLHPIYRQVSGEEAILIANLSAELYVTTKDLHYGSWAASQTAEEGAKAETWRREGREAVLDSVKSRLASIETLQTELAIARASIEKLREYTEEAAVQRVEILWTNKKAELEVEKLKEISALKEQISEAALAKQLISVLEDKNDSLKVEKERALAELKGDKEKAVAELKAQVVALEAAT
jgi:hypothetical protein